MGETKQEPIKAESTTTGQRYRKLGLRRNPFSGQILPGDHPTIPPYKSVRDRIGGFIEAFVENRQSRALIFVGDYGTGKTYHQKWMKSQFDIAEEISVRTVYLETPGSEPYDLIRGILSEIGEEQIAKGVWNVVQQQVIQEINSAGQSAFLSRFARDQKVKTKGQPPRTVNPYQSGFGMESYGGLTEEDVLDHRRFLEAFDSNRLLDRVKLRDYVQELLIKDGETGVTKNIGAAKELASICCFSGAPALESWENLIVPGVASSRLFPAQGEPSFLQAIVRILQKSGVDYFVLFLDELEKVPLLKTMTERDAHRYMDTIRMLMDRSWQPLPFAWVLSGNEEAWNWIRSHSEALSDRIIDVVDLPRADDPDLATYIIREFIREARMENSIVPEKNPLFPFPKNLLHLIPVPLRKTPRALIKICDLILETAARDPKLELPISQDVIASVTERLVLRAPAGTQNE